MAVKLGDLIDRNALRQLAGSRYFGRGEGYFEDGAVNSLRERDETITARVSGTHVYRTKIFIEDGEIDFSCSCPLGIDGEFCKHLVATGLEWLDGSEDDGDGEDSQTREDLRNFLSKKKKNELVELILEQTDRDEALRERLTMDVAGRSSKSVDISKLKAIIDEVISVDDFIHYQEMWDYSERLDQVTEFLRSLIETGRAEAVVELAEHALACTESSMEYVDDSSGIMGPFLEELVDLHFSACTITNPDPILLAQRLFAWQIRSSWDTFYDAVVRYANILGEAGLEEFHCQAEAEWALIPNLGPGQDDPNKYGKRSRVTHIMLGFAELSGSISDRIEIERRDLSSEHRFLTIAALYRDAERYDEALEWAERGVKSFPNTRDSRLLEFLAGEYQRKSRHDEAMKIIWSLFVKWPSLDTYSVLRNHAKRAKVWSTWREKALTSIREEISKGKKHHYKRGFDRWGFAPDHSLLVEIFLNEKDPDSAWDEAKAGGCHNNLWMALARRREKQHPEDAASVYQRLVEPIVNQKDKRSYKEAAKLIQKIQELMTKIGEEKQFTLYLSEVRANHKRKRNFMAALDRVGLE